MELRIYAIYDTKAAAFNTPFTAHTDELAIRSAKDVAADTNTVYGRHPEDFVLYHVGIFNDQTGEVAGITPALHVAAFVELVEQRPLPLMQEVS